MYKLISVINAEKEYPKIPGVTDDFHYNHMPTPFVECSQDEFLHKSAIDTHNYEDYRQITDLIAGSWLTVRIYYYHNNAYAIAYPNKWHCCKPADNMGFGIQYEEKPKYYRIGCKHEWRELGAAECRERNINHYGRCYHVQECTLCKIVEAYDSSD